jgi:hypothetical protein
VGSAGGVEADFITKFITQDTTLSALAPTQADEADSGKDDERVEFPEELSA